MKRYFVFIFAMLLGSLLAQQYTLENLIVEGLENSSDVISSSYDLSDSKAGLYSSYLSFLPSANLGYSQNQQRDYGWNVKSGSYNMGFGLSLNEARIFNIKQSTISYKVSQLNRAEAKRVFAYSVLDKYTRVLETQTNLEISRQNLELQQKIQEQTRIMYENGQNSLLDYKQSQLNLIDHEIQVKTNENNLINLRADLFSYLNIKDNGNELEDLSLEVDANVDFHADTDNIRKLEYNVKSAKINKFQDLMGFIPTLSANWNYSSYGSDIGGISDYQHFADNYEFTINLSVDFLDYPDKYLNHGIQGRLLKRAKLNLDDAKREQFNSYTNQANSLKTLKTTFELYEQKKQLAGENLTMAQEQYSLGIIGLIDLDRFKIDYQNAQVSYNSAYYELIRARENLNLLLSNKIMGKW